MDYERKVDVHPPTESQAEQVHETREYLETVSSERDAPVPSAQDQGAVAEADTLGDAIAGAPD